MRCSAKTAVIDSEPITGSVSAFQIVGALHFVQARNCPAKSFRGVAVRVQLFGGRSGGTDQLHILVIERVDQNDEAACFIALLGTKPRNMIDENGTERMRNREIVGGGERADAKIGE